MHKNQCYSCSHEFIDTANNFGTEIIAEALELIKIQQKKIEELESEKRWQEYPDMMGKW